MSEKGLRSRVHGCSRFFKREGMKNLQPMIGKGVRCLIHFEFIGIRNALSLPLISPVYLPDKHIRPAKPQPVVLNRNTKTILLIDRYTTETKTSTKPGACGLQVGCNGEAKKND